MYWFHDQNIELISRSRSRTELYYNDWFVEKWFEKPESEKKLDLGQSYDAFLNLDSTEQILLIELLREEVRALRSNKEAVWENEFQAGFEKWKTDLTKWVLSQGFAQQVCLFLPGQDQIINGHDVLTSTNEKRWTDHSDYSCLESFTKLLIHAPMLSEGELNEIHDQSNRLLRQLITKPYYGLLEV